MLGTLVAVQALLVAGSPVAEAQTSCGAVPVGAQVFIDKPASGPVTLPFVVTGRAVATLALSRVDLLIGGTVVASRTYPPATNLSFEFSVGPSQTTPGARAVSAVACSAGLSLVRGQSASVVVDVQAPVTTTTTVVTDPVPSTAPAVPTTVVAVPVPARSTTTSTPVPAKKTITPPPQDREAPADPEGLADTSADAAADRPVRLTDGDSAKGSDRPPLWVGAVVGLSGLAGLTLSGLVRRRSSTPADTLMSEASPSEGPPPSSGRPVDPNSLSRSAPTVRTG